MGRTPSVYRVLLICGVVLIAGCAVGSTPVNATTTQATGQSTDRVSVTHRTVVAQSSAVNYSTPAGDTNRTVRYVDPGTVSTTPRRATSLERAGLQLAESLGVRLEVSANELVQQDYDDAEAQLGDAYQSDVVRLTEITEATENASDEQIARALESAGTTQRSAVSDAKQFRTLYNEYQQARANQNTTEARAVAQELAATTTELNRTSTNLTAAYAELASLNETQAMAAQQRIDQALTQAEQLSQNAQQSTYIETNVTVDAVSPTASPHRPLRVSGTLTDANGTALTNRTIELDTPRANPQATTNENGSFVITHLPRRVSTGDPTLTLRYVPEETAGYLGNETTVAPTIVGRQSSISVHSVPSTLSNTTSTNVVGTVSVDGRTISGVPVRVLLDGAVLNETATNQTGAFRLPISPPITTSTGEAQLTIEAGGQGDAVGLARERRTVSIESVETDLSFDATRSNNTTVAVSGRLTRNDSQPLKPQLLTVTAANQTIGYVQTDATGRFASTFTLTEDHPAIDGTEQTVTIAARFAPGATHLTPARAETTVTFFPKDGLFGYGVSPLEWVFGAAIGLFVIGGAIVIRWSRVDDTDDTNEGLSTRVTTDAPVEAGPSANEVPPATLFERADETVESAPAEALHVGYLASRQALAAELDADDALSKPSATHWEFYRAVETADAVDTELTATFESLTETYEHSTYGGAHASSDTVRDALSAMRSQLSSTALIEAS